MAKLPKHPAFQFSPKVETIDKSTIFLTNQEGIESVENYLEIIEYLREKKEGDEITLSLSGPGGQLNTAIVLMNEIAECKAVIIADILGGVASGHSMIALACDVIVTHPGSSVMLHTFSGGNYGKGRDAEVASYHTNKQMEEVFTEHIQGFLSKDEISNMLEVNRDLYFTGEDLRNRIVDLYQFRTDNGLNKPNVVIQFPEETLVDTDD